MKYSTLYYQENLSERRLVTKRLYIIESKRNLYLISQYYVDQWAVTLSLIDGCFQAYFLASLLIFVLLTALLFSTLASDRGCFPLDISPLRENVWVVVLGQATS